MKFLEKNLEGIIYESDWKALFDRELYDVGKNIQIVLVGNSHCPQSGVQFLYPVFWIDTCEIPLNQQSVVGVRAYTYEYLHDGIRFNELYA